MKIEETPKETNARNAELASIAMEMFDAYVAEGFTDWQACVIIGTFQAAGV